MVCSRYIQQGSRLTLLTCDWIFLLISDWCAKIYEHGKYKGWEKVIGETSKLDLMGNENDALSSLKVLPGCTLKVFADHNNEGLLKTFTNFHNDDDIVDDFGPYTFDDQVSSLSCTCQGGKYDKKILFKEQ